MTKYTQGEWKPILDSARLKRQTPMAMVACGTGGEKCADFTGSGKNYAEDCANATLAAAAPDMYSALDRAWTCIQKLLSGSSVRDADETLSEISSALRKAEGK